MRLTTDNFILEKTTLAIVEDSKALTEANPTSSKDHSLAVACDIKKEPRHRASEGNINPVRRLVSTSSSTSSQSLANTCCQYVSVVVTNEPTPINRVENNITCHTDLTNKVAHENDILDPNPSCIPDMANNKNELTHNDSIDKDIPSEVANSSGNHDKVHTRQDIIKHDENSVNNMVEADTAPEDNKECVNVKQSDSVAFTDESCIQYIDSDESIDSEL